MVENAVRIKIGAELDTKQVEREIESLKRRINKAVSVGIALDREKIAREFKQLTQQINKEPIKVGIQLDVEEIKKQLQEAIANIKLPLTLDIKQVMTRGGMSGQVGEPDPTKQQSLRTLKSRPGAAIAQELDLDQVGIEKQKEKINLALDAVGALSKAINEGLTGEIAGELTDQDVVKIAERAKITLEGVSNIANQVNQFKEEFLAATKTGKLRLPEPGIEEARAIVQRTEGGSRLLQLSPQQLQQQFPGADPQQIRRDLIRSIGQLAPQALQEVQGSLEQLPSSRRFGSELARIKGRLTKALNIAKREAKKEGIEIGEAVSEGLGQGITNSEPVATEKVEELALMSLETLDKILEISSPSKAARDRGEAISEGLGEGIEDGAPKATSKAKKTINDVLNEIDDQIKRESQRETDLGASLTAQPPRMPTMEELEQTIQDIKPEDLELEISPEFIFDPNIPDRLKEQLQDVRDTVRETGESFDASNRKFEEAAEATEDLINSYNNGVSSAENFEDQTKEVKGLFGELGRSITLTGKALISFLALQKIFQVFQKIAGGAIRAALAFERLRIGIAANRLGDVSKQIDDLRKNSDRLGISFNIVAENYGSFTRALIGTDLQPLGADIFQSITTGLAGLQVTSDAANGALLALQQIASKGIVSSEEIRQQLGERLPGSLAIAARALGKSQAEFNRILESGALASADFLPKFAAQLERESLVNAIIGGETAQASLIRFQNQIEEIQTTIGSALLPVLKFSADVAAGGLRLANENATLTVSLLGAIGLTLATNVIVGLVEAVRQTKLLGIASAITQKTFALLGLSVKGLKGTLLAGGGLVAALTLAGIAVGEIVKDFNRGNERLKAGIKLVRELNRELVKTGQTGLGPQIGQSFSEFRKVVTDPQTGVQFTLVIPTDELKEFARDVELTRKNIEGASKSIPLVDEQFTQQNLDNIRNQLQKFERDRIAIQGQIRIATVEGDTKRVSELRERLREITVAEKEFKDANVSLLPILTQQVEILELGLERLKEAKQEQLDLTGINVFGNLDQDIADAEDALNSARKTVEELNQSLDVIPEIAANINREFGQLATNAANIRFQGELRQLRTTIAISPELSEGALSSVLDTIEATAKKRDLLAIEEQFNRGAELFRKRLGDLGLDNPQGGAILDNIRNILGISGDGDLIAEAIAALSPEGIQLAIDRLEKSGQELNANEKAIVEQLSNLLTLKREQLTAERDILNQQRQIQQATQARLTSIRQSAVEGIGAGITAGVDISGFEQTLAQVGEITQGELSNLTSAAELNALVLARSTDRINRIQSKFDAERARLERRTALDLTTQIQQINQQVARGDLTRAVGNQLRRAAELRTQVIDANNQAGIFGEQLREINKLANAGLTTQESRLDAINKRRQESTAIQQEINNLLVQGVGFDDARVQSLEQQLEQSEKILQILSSAELDIDPRQLQQVREELRLQIAEAENKAIELKAEADTTEAEAMIEKLTRRREIELDFIEGRKLDATIDLLRGRIQRGIIPELNIDPQRFIDLNALDARLNTLRNTLDTLNEEIATAVDEGAETEAIQRLEDERRNILRSIRDANLEIANGQIALVNEFQGVIRSLQSGLGDAFRQNLQATRDLTIGRLEREGADEKAIAQARLDFLNQEKSIELELAKIEERRLAIAARQLQLETRQATSRAREEAEQAIEAFQESPTSASRRRAFRAIDRLRIAEQQEALADVNAGELARVAALREDTFRKTLQNQQEALIEQARQEGITGLRPGEVGSAGIQSQINRSLESSVGRIEGDRGAIIDGFLRGESLDNKRNNLLRTLVEQTRPESMGVAGMGAGASITTGFFGDQGIQFANIDTVGRFATSGIGGSGLQTSPNNQLTNEKLDEIAQGQKTQRSPISIGDININLEVVDTDNNPELAEDVANRTIEKIAAGIQELTTN